MDRRAEAMARKGSLGAYGEGRWPQASVALGKAGNYLLYFPESSFIFCTFVFLWTCENVECCCDYNSISLLYGQNCTAGPSAGGALATEGSLGARQAWPTSPEWMRP